MNKHIFNKLFPDYIIRKSKNEFDYQIDHAFSMAKQTGIPPISAAQKIQEDLQKSAIIDNVTITGPGFVNFNLKNDFLAKDLKQLINTSNLGIHCERPYTIVIDYSSANVAKELHVGHLRTTIIGDAICRVLMFLGHKVIRQNHLGDWGTQFGFLLEYLLENNILPKSIPEVSKLYKIAQQRFKDDEIFIENSKKRLLLLQNHEQETFALWQHLEKLTRDHLEVVFAKLGVLLVDADIRGESFYNPLLQALLLDLETQGLLQESQGAKVMHLEGFVDKEKNPIPLIVQKSDGSFLYASTDLAAAKYRSHDLRAKTIIYVTDQRQKQHFAMLFQAVSKTNWNSSEMKHVAFGTVLGDDKKPLKSRTGEVISLDDLLDEAIERANQIIKDRDLKDPSKIARKIGIGALKYADLSNDLIKDYVFSWDKLLSFQGNTGPYLQNAYVRAKAILRKAKGQEIANEPAWYSKEERQLWILLWEMPEVMVQFSQKLTPHILANHLYQMAQGFHEFYEKCPVLNTEYSASRLLLCQSFAKFLNIGLNILGIETMEEM